MNADACNVARKRIEDITAEVEVGRGGRRLDAEGREFRVEEAVDGPRATATGRLEGRQGGEPLAGEPMTVAVVIGVASGGLPPGRAIGRLDLGLDGGRNRKPSGVGKRSRCTALYNHHGHGVGRTEARRKLADLGPAVGVAHAEFHDEVVPLPVARDVADGLPVSGLHDPHPGWAAAVGHEHRLVAVAADLGGRQVGQPLAIEPDSHRPATADHEPLATPGQADTGRGPEDARHLPIGPQAAFVVPDGQLGQRERLLIECRRGHRVGGRPGVFFHRLEDFEPHAARRQRANDGSAGCEASREPDGEHAPSHCGPGEIHNRFAAAEPDIGPTNNGRKRWRAELLAFPTVRPLFGR